MAEVTAARGAGVGGPGPDGFVPAAGEEGGVITFGREGEGCEGGGGAAVDVGGFTGLLVNVVLVSRLLAVGRILRVWAYILEEDSSSCSSALGYVYSFMGGGIRDDGEDLALQADGSAIVVGGLEFLSGGFGKRLSMEVQCMMV